MSWIKAVNLRLLIHLIGDIHQPLHATTYYSPKYPKGDRGGNEFHITCSQNSQVTNLHALWDWMFGLTPSTMPPVSSDDKAKIRTLSTQLRSDLPISSFSNELKIVDYKSMAKESFGFSASNVYVNINADSTVTDSYFSTNLAVCKRRITLAGYRMAIALKRIMNAQ